MEPTPADVVNGANLFAFTLFLVLSAIRMVARVIRYRRTKLPMPRLLPRDLVLVVGLVTSLLPILTVRAFDLVHIVTGQVWWAAATGLPAVIAVAVMAYYEFFIIER